MTEYNKPLGAESTEKLEFMRLELEQAFKTYRSQFQLLIQMATLLTVANVTVAGFAIADRSAGILLVCAAFPVIILYLMGGMNRAMQPIVYSAIFLERKLGGDADVDWVAQTFAKMSISEQAVDQILRVCELADPGERMRQVRSVFVESPIGSRSFMRSALILLTLGQLLAAVVLFFGFNWLLF